ncbi:IS1167 transposase [Streptococcus pneumoniae]|nr:IS1167 transposase [Streptococcus pneumoniae]
MMVAETSIVKKNHQIPRIINQKIPNYRCRQ